MPIARFQPLVRGTLALFASLLVASVALSFPQRGALTKPRNLGELVDEAGIIIRGHIISAQVEPHPQYPALWTVVVTLQIEESFKGAVAGTYTFRQYIWDFRDRADAAGYQKGGHLLLLLLKPNANGLSSPAGIEQGRFTVRSDRTGRLLATNGRNNVGLLANVAEHAAGKGIRLSSRTSAVLNVATSGPLSVDDLGALIREIVGTSQ